jgi:hypothetical protein
MTDGVTRQTEVGSAATLHLPPIEVVLVSVCVVVVEKPACGVGRIHLATQRLEPFGAESRHQRFTDH